MSRARDVADGALGTIAGTNGQVLTSNGTVWSSQAVPTELPAHGTSGNLLTSNGSAWISQAAAGGGAWTFLSEVVSTSSTTVNFSNVFTSTYDNYRIMANNVGGNTSDVNYSAKVELSGNLGTYVDYNYVVYTHKWSTYPEWNYSATPVPFTRNQNHTSGSTFRSNFYVDIFNPISTNAKSMSVRGVGHSATATISAQIIDAVCVKDSSTSQTGIQFFASSGTMTGTYRLYGFAKS